MPARRQPARLGAALERLTADLAPSTPLATIQAVWSSVVGDRIAGSCTPEREQDGVLTIACETAVWTQQLSMMQAEIISKLASELDDPAQVPKEIRFVVSGD